MGDNTRHLRHTCQIGPVLRLPGFKCLNVIRTVVASEAVQLNTHLYLIDEVFVSMPAIK